MINADIWFPYDLTRKELEQAHAHTTAFVLTGKWRLAVRFFSLFRALSFVAIAFFLLRWGSAHLADWLYFLLLAGTFLFAMVLRSERRVHRALQTHSHQRYLQSKVMKGQMLQVSATGLVFDNGRSRTFWSWLDVDDLLQAGDMLIATQGNQYIPMPDRMVEQLGALDEAKAQIVSWFEASKDAP